MLAIPNVEASERDGVERDDDARARHTERGDLGAQREADRFQRTRGDRNREAVVADSPGQVLALLAAGAAAGRNGGGRHQRASGAPHPPPPPPPGPPPPPPPPP